MSGSDPTWTTSREAAADHGMALAWQAARDPQRTAVIAGSIQRSFGELNQRANQLARVFRAAGLSPHSGVALICSNRPEFLEAHAACLRSGLRITPINWHLTGEEMAYIVADCEAQAIIAEDRFAQAATQARSTTKALKLALAVGGPMQGFGDYDSRVHQAHGHDLPDPCLGSPMLYTSGTTGHPKGVYRWPPRRSGVAEAIVSATIDLDPGQDMGLVTGPLYHAAPLNLNAIPLLNDGVGLVLMDRWDAEETLRLIERHRIAYTHMVATMFHRLLGLDPVIRNRYDLSSLRCVIHGAAPCPAHIKRGIIDWLGPVVFEYYAATEGGGTLVDSQTWLEHPGTVGRSLSEGGVRILDTQDRDCGPGEVGKVYLKAPEQGRFVYFKAPGKTGSAYHEDYYSMGDEGYLDAGGYLFLTGRDAEIIIRGGVNVYPQEVDDVLLRSPKVHDACTVGVPSEEWGEEVKAVVCLDPRVSPSVELETELIALCQGHLAGFKCPRSIDFDPELPRLPSGKIQRNKVRARYWAGNQASI